MGTDQAARPRRVLSTKGTAVGGPKESEHEANDERTEQQLPTATHPTSGRGSSVIASPEVTMSRLSHLFVRLAALATTVMGFELATVGRATARTCVDPQTGSLRFCPRSDGGYDGSIPPPVQQVTDNSNRSLQWVLFAAAVFGALAIVAVVADLLTRHRWRQPPLEAALQSSDPDELPRAAGLLGDLLAQQRHDGAAEHAYRAAIDVGDEYWSPLAQVALADLLRERGKRSEAQALLEAVIDSGHPRAVPAAQVSLDQLRTGRYLADSVGTVPNAYETLA